MESVQDGKKKSYSRMLKELEIQARMATEKGEEFVISKRRAALVKPIVESELSLYYSIGIETEDLTFNIDTDTPVSDDDNDDNYMSLENEEEVSSHQRSIVQSDLHCNEILIQQDYNDPSAVSNVFKNLHFILSGFTNKEEMEEICTKIRRGNGKIISHTALLNAPDKILTNFRCVIIYGNPDALQYMQQDANDLYSYPHEVLIALALDLKILKSNWIDACLQFNDLNLEQTNPNHEQFMVKNVGRTTINNVLNQVIQDTDDKDAFNLKPKLRNRVFYGRNIQFFICCISDSDIFQQFYSRLLKLAGAKVIDDIKYIDYKTIILAQNSEVVAANKKLSDIIEDKHLPVVSQYYIYACIAHRESHDYFEEALILRKQIEELKRQREQKNRFKRKMLQMQKDKKLSSERAMNPVVASELQAIVKTNDSKKKEQPQPVKKVAMIPNLGLYIKNGNEVDRYVENDVVELEEPSGSVVMIIEFIEEKYLKKDGKDASALNPIPTRKFRCRIFKRFDELPESAREQINNDKDEKRKKRRQQQSLFLSDEVEIYPVVNIKRHFRLISQLNKNAVYCNFEETDLGVAEITHDNNRDIWNNPLHPYREYRYDNFIMIPRDIPTKNKRKLIFVPYGPSKIKSFDNITREIFKSASFFGVNWNAGSYARLWHKPIPNTQNSLSSCSTVTQVVSMESTPSNHKKLVETIGLLRNFFKEINHTNNRHNHYLTLIEFNRHSHGTTEPLRLVKVAPESKRIIRVDTIKKMELLFLVAGKDYISPTSNVFFYL